MTAYEHQDIEQRWQEYWERNRTFRTPAEVDTSRPKFYVLDMFPYPSGAGLHVGHPLGYIATDIVARYKRMCGLNVLHPIGFDAFGLPAEQYAVEHGVHPRITTERNIANMLRQLKRLGLSYDYDRAFATTDESYYRWTQWIFLQLYHAYYDREAERSAPIAELVEALQRGDRFIDVDGNISTQRTDDAVAWSSLAESEKEEILSKRRLAYIAEVPVNWCPGLGTVLANEEVTNEGRSERGNFEVYRRPLRQWMLRITEFAPRLLDDLEFVEWPDSVKTMQRNWIGRSTGAQADFIVAGPDGVQGSDNVLRIYTTRPDTLFGATYMVLAPEHPVVDEITTTDQAGAVQSYKRQAAQRSDVDRMAEARQKTGAFTGAFAINPVNGESIPIWIADYVVMGYGTGAIMAVPAHDQRDFDFAKTFGLPIRVVMRPPEDWLNEVGMSFDEYEQEPARLEVVFAGEGVATNSASGDLSLDGLPTDEAKAEIIRWLEVNGVGRAQTQYKLRDWLFSRQRYWGEPFPIVHGPDGEVLPVDEDDLPVQLPDMSDFKPSASDDPDAPPRPPLTRADPSWRYVGIDGKTYERELNTMPNWAGSCWYYLRFIDPKNENRLADAELERYWMGDNGVDLYIGGVEHAVLHLLYARFWHKALFDLGYVSGPEPFGRLVNQGYIQAYAYRDERGIIVAADEVVDQDGRAALEVQDQPGRQFYFDGQKVTQEYGKMGKSLKNIVNPDDILSSYGCDTLRLYEMYLGPIEQSKPWNTRDIVGVNRFLRRVWRNFVNPDTGALLVVDKNPAADLERTLARTIKRVTEDLDRLSFNTAIAALIELNNELVQHKQIPRSSAETFVLLLAPLAPHIAEELWSRLGHSESLAYEHWPTYDQALLSRDSLTIAVQVNGKVRGSITVPAKASKDEVLISARDEANVARHLEGRALRREIYVPGKIVNIVVE